MRTKRLDERQTAKRIGQAIAVLRMSRQLTQATLAELLGVEQETISRFERGERLPSLLRLEEIADALNCPLEQLLQSGSQRQADQDAVIQNAMRDLSDRDRVWVTDGLIQLCERLRAVKSAK